MDEDVFRYQGAYFLLVAIGPRYAVMKPLDGTYVTEVTYATGETSFSTRSEWVYPLSPTPSEPADYGLERPERLPFEVQLELAAIRHGEDVMETWQNAYLAHATYEPLPLTNEQLAFMLKHHGEIVRASFIPDFLSLASPGPREPKIIGDVLARRTFRRVFGPMSWDDAFDRYEDLPAYDDFFKMLLHYAYALAHGLGGWALNRHLKGYDPAHVPLLLEFRATYPDTFSGLVATVDHIRSSLKGAPDYDANLDAFSRDAAEQVRRLRTKTWPQR